MLSIEQLKDIFELKDILLKHLLEIGGQSKSNHTVCRDFKIDISLEPDPDETLFIFYHLIT